jgi:hypothetical protein
VSMAGTSFGAFRLLLFVISSERKAKQQKWLLPLFSVVLCVRASRLLSDVHKGFHKASSTNGLPFFLSLSTFVCNQLTQPFQNVNSR